MLFSFLHNGPLEEFDLKLNWQITFVSPDTGKYLTENINLNSGIIYSTWKVQKP